jgi:membrane protein insertase Oxa1/YidC/SpoIIIJ
MEVVDLLYLAVVAILAIFVAVSSVVFLRQRWSLAGHGDAQPQKEKTVIYPVIIFVLVVFIFLQQRWSLKEHGDALQLRCGAPCYWSGN